MILKVQEALINNFTTIQLIRQCLRRLPIFWIVFRRKTSSCRAYFDLGFSGTLAPSATIPSLAAASSTRPYYSCVKAPRQSFFSIISLEYLRKLLSSQS